VAAKEIEDTLPAVRSRLLAVAGAVIGEEGMKFLIDNEKT